MQKKNNFWQDHSLHYLEMAFRYDKQGTIENPDGYGGKTGDCGDTIEMFLSIRNGQIKAVSYKTNGCLNTNACSNTVVLLAEGKSIEEAWGISQENVSDYLMTLPPDHHHCAELAVGALYLALANYSENKKISQKTG